MNPEEIKEFLPHRAPMLLVDEAHYEGEDSVSRYTIPDDPYFVQGHFPGNPIVPGVILCEIMAQGSFLLMKELLHDKLAMYAGLDKVRFKKSVRPGDQVVVKASTVSKRSNFVAVTASAYVGEELCCSGNLNFILIPKEKALEV